MTPEQTDQLFDQASKLEQRGDRKAAIEIYDRLAKELAGQENAEYALNSAKRLREYESMAPDKEDADAPPFFHSSRRLYLATAPENLPRLCIACGSQDEIADTSVKVRKPAGMSIVGPTFARTIGRIKLPACSKCRRRIFIRRSVVIFAMLLPMFLLFGGFMLPNQVKAFSWLILWLLPILVIAFFFGLRRFDLVRAHIDRKHVVIKDAGRTFLDDIPDHSSM